MKAQELDWHQQSCLLKLVNNSLHAIEYNKTLTGLIEGEAGKFRLFHFFCFSFHLNESIIPIKKIHWKRYFIFDKLINISGTGKTRLLLNFIVAMSTLHGRDIKILITASDDMIMYKIANDLHEARRQLSQENRVFGEKLNFLIYDHQNDSNYPNIAKYNVRKKLEAMPQTNSIDGTQIYRKIISDANIVFCPYRRLYKLNK